MGLTNRGNTYKSYDFDEMYHELKRDFTVLNSRLYVNVNLPAGVTYQFNISPRYQYWFNQEFWSADLPTPTPTTAV